MASEEVKQKGLEALEEFKMAYLKKTLQQTDRMDVVLPQGQKYFNIYVFSDLYLGAPLNMPKINKLMADIDQAKNDPNAIVIIGGNIVAYEVKKTSAFTTVQKTNIAYALFEPIKDKIVAIINGPFEDSFAKRNTFPARTLAKKLGIPDKYFPDGVDLKMIIQNEYTHNTAQVVTVFASGVKSKANTFSAVGNLAEKLAIQHGIADVNIFTCVNKSFAPRRVIQRATDTTDHVELVPYYIIGNSGYKSYINLPNNKLVEPNYSDNKIYHIVVGENLDSDNTDKKTISKPKYKVYLERHSFGAEVTTREEIQLTDLLERGRKKNKMLAGIMKGIIEEILAEQQDELETDIDNQKATIRANRPIVVDIDEEYQRSLMEDPDDELDEDESEEA